MDDLLSELGRSSHLPFSVIAARLVLAAILGAAVGFEREWHKRPAGLRTHILVCVAAATVAVLTVEITHVADFEEDSIRIDPIRIIEAVTGGVAFLAAGFIIFTRGEVHGLTPGAGMWLAGAIGLAAGLGFWQVAVIATLLALIVLGLLRLLEARFSPKAAEGQHVPNPDENADGR
jgi:putative Mg2+ transporter-C (MgtC) family protein